MEFTKAGIGVAGSSLAFLAIGWWADYPELITLGFAGIAALVLACSRMIGRPRLSVSRDVRPARTGVGDSAHTVITIENVTRRRASSIVLVDTIQNEQRRSLVPPLAEGQRHVLSSPLPTTRRGVYRLGPLKLGRCDPLGLMWFGTRHPLLTTFRVHPQLHLVAPTLLGRTPDMDGPVTGEVQPPGAAFYSLREYRRGDDWRLIHWKSTARLGALIVRHEVRPIEPYLMVILDTSAAAHTERSFENAVSAAASLCVAGARAGFPLELRSTGGLVFSISAGLTEPNPLNQLLDLLTEIQLAQRGSLAALPSLVPAETGTSLTVFTGQPQSDDLKSLTALQTRFSIVTLIQFAKSSAKRPTNTVSGVVTLNVGTSEEFAAGWNELVRR